MSRTTCAVAVVLVVPCIVSGSDRQGPPSPHEMAERIDGLAAVRWQQEGIEPAPLAGDAEFLRRVSLDLVGVVPRVSEVREFLADRRPDKRARAIDRLLSSPRHATHMANTWRRIMLPGALGLEQLENVAGVQNWLRRQFAQNMRYDRIVADFLVASGGGQAGPALFYTSQELKPEKLAASTSRIFLGLQIACAECHDHPFDDWTQKDFWGYAAFFARLDQAQPAGRRVSLIDRPEGEVTLPETDTVVAPQYPDRSQPGKEAAGSRRVQLAIWMASRDNPYLPRAAVNRTWAQLFGRGLVEPVDDLGKHNPASMPQVMDELTDFFVASGFDLRELIRALANSRLYQRSSRAPAHAPESRLFARMAVKTLTAEQLYDCLNRVLRRNRPVGPFPFAARGVFDPQRIAFAAKMQMRGANATEFEAGVLQALAMLNGSQTAALTDVEESGLLAALQAPLFDTDQQVETLFLATLSRMPRDSERTRFVEYVAAGGATGDTEDALGDVLWALLNSAEFMLNH